MTPAVTCPLCPGPRLPELESFLCPRSIQSEVASRQASVGALVSVHEATMPPLTMGREKRPGPWTRADVGLSPRSVVC